MGGHPPTPPPQPPRPSLSPRNPPPRPQALEIAVQAALPLLDSFIADFKLTKAQQKKRHVDPRPALAPRYPPPGPLRRCKGCKHSPGTPAISPLSRGGGVKVAKCNPKE